MTSTISHLIQLGAAFALEGALFLGVAARVRRARIRGAGRLALAVRWARRGLAFALDLCAMAAAAGLLIALALIAVAVGKAVTA